MTNYDEILRYFVIALIVIVALVIVGIIIKIILRSPFEYPYFNCNFDVSRKRNVDIENLIDRYLIENRFTPIREHMDQIENWKMASEYAVNDAILKKLRLKQYQEAIDDGNAFVFVTERNQTRYKQKNYVRTPYVVKMQDDSYSCSYEDLKERYEELEKINFKCTLKEYYSKNKKSKWD